MNLKSVLIIVLAFKLADAKKYKYCELAKELHSQHNIVRDEIYKHMCVASVDLETDMNLDGEYLGIFVIGKKWWCGIKETGGSCNVKCSDLTNDNLTDDVVCAKKIIDSQGLEAWGLEDEDCQDDHKGRTTECLEKIENEATKPSLESYTKSTNEQNDHNDNHLK